MRDATGIQCMEIIQEQISTHAPHAGRDVLHMCYDVDRNNFYSRAPCGTRPDCSTHEDFCQISTHAPHAGRDQWQGIVVLCGTNFYSRAPCGTRQHRLQDKGKLVSFLLTRPMRDATTMKFYCILFVRFLLTRPMRDATNPLFHFLYHPLISTHAPHAGRDEI